MQTLHSLIAEVERRKKELDYQLDYTKETYDNLSDDEKAAFNSDLEKLQEKIATVAFVLEEAQKAVKQLQEIKWETDYLDREEDKIAPYRGANCSEIQEIRERSNELENRYSELYNETLYSLQNIK